MILSEKDLQPVDSLGVLLTSGCNLDCRYCYRSNNTENSLTWRDLRETLDWAVATPGRELEVIFSGGEPLLEFDLLRKAIIHLGNRRRGGVPPKIRLLTNGVLLDPAKVDFLVENSVHVNLSFDGVRSAQDQRGSGTWKKLDFDLDMMIERHPDWFTSHFLVTMTLTPENLPHLAESVAYLLEKNVETIGISPALSRVPGWNDDVMDELDVQMSRIFQLGKRIFQKSGKVPFLPFRKYSDNELPVGQKQRTCAALESRSPVLDVDGTLYSCLMFAPSGLDSSDRRLVEITQDTIFGKVGSPDLEERRREFSSGIRNRDVFSSAPDLESIYGKCSECPAAALCKICPLSLLEFSSGPAPKAVPALLCAYYYLIMKYSRMFPVQDDPSPPRVTPESIRARMRHWNKVHEKIPGS